MKIKIKLSILMIAIVMAVAGSIAVIELVRATDIASSLAKQKTMYLARQRAQYWEGRINAYLQMLHTAADVMGHYENIAVGERRAQYEELLMSIFANQPDFVRMFTVWKPNALDGMDSHYIGRPGSTETGQLAFAVGRETGSITTQTAQVVPAAMEHIAGPNAKNESVSNPTAIKLLGKDVYCIRLMVPITNVPHR